MGTAGMYTDTQSTYRTQWFTEQGAQCEGHSVTVRALPFGSPGLHHQLILGLRPLSTPQLTKKSSKQLKTKLLSPMLVNKARSDFNIR